MEEPLFPDFWNFRLRVARGLHLIIRVIIFIASFAKKSGMRELLEGMAHFFFLTFCVKDCREIYDSDFNYGVGTTAQIEHGHG